ncbi:hypothetical protein GSU69_16685 [Rathayibacter festucae]|uniref:Alpha-L-rhamnosidase C-terminal domain-containing protein n=1 Tax=Rathayibacter festucae TaxID=110937 RepID=A0ABX6H542_9MICO|nr:hypothetical protein GSU69_16685 [Rathayibacter festucae]
MRHLRGCPGEDRAGPFSEGADRRRAADRHGSLGRSNAEDEFGSLLARDVGSSWTTPYGRASFAWTLADGELRVEVEVPVGATAVLDLEGAEPRALGPGRHTAVVATGAAVAAL